jgi:hypothetical protein
MTFMIDLDRVVVAGSGCRSENRGVVDCRCDNPGAYATTAQRHAGDGCLV